MRTIEWPRVLATVVDGQDLDEDTAAAVLSDIMGGEVDPARTAGLLTALRAKGESLSLIHI